MKRVLSGIQASGTLHIGNYLAMMKPMIDFQETSELFCFIANYHAMTSLTDGKTLALNTIEAATDFLALGIDPDKCCFWVLSDIPEVNELTWILSCHTPLGLLERSHSYKDKIARGLSPNTGLYTYPILMAADILLFQANSVPTGKDQKQHLEITRDIAIKFNNTYGEVFTIPETHIPKEFEVIPGIDGQKMSKSYGNTLNMFDDEKTLKKKIMKIVTDSTPVEDPKDPDKCTVFTLYKLFADKPQTEQLRNRYLQGGMGYGEAKKELFELILNYFAPYRKKREALASDPAQVANILKKGACKARETAYKTLDNVKRAVGLTYY
jgi:tryptophanyl-tRNA synthetase